MTHTEPQGLLAIWADVDTEYESEFVQWHNCEHMAERVNIPGFHVGHRYRAMDEARDFFMVYETDTADIMQSQPYLHSQNNPTPWTRQSVGHFRDARRTIYSLVAMAGQRPALDAPYVLLVRSNPPQTADSAAEVIRWYQQEHLPRLCAVEGTLRARLYRSDLGISNIVTAERQVHGASSGTHEFLALYELLSPDIPGSDAWCQAARGTEWSAAMVTSLRDLERERYWLDFALWAPGHS
ncbi:hypothetical protein NKDENANG_00107 [Candidatus Entotheonellaceae bacterium PAL068K]